MGYSARYHAASLAAVFLALAIGILIGVGFGDEVVSDTKKNLEQSLTGDLEAARGRADDLARQLNQSNEFGDRIYPVLVSDRLQDLRIGVVALGGLPDDISRDLEAALEPTGGRLVAVAVIREPPDLRSLAGELQGARYEALRRENDVQVALAKNVGRQLVLGGPLLDRVRGQLLSRASGRFGVLDGLIVVRQQPSEMNPHDQEITDRLEAGFLDGVTAAGVPAVGVETTETDPSSISFFSGHGLATVDDLDAPSGRVAMIFALLGAEGSFGVKDSADRLLPDLLTPSPRQTPGAGR